MLMEKVFKHILPLNCKKKLIHLQDSDVSSIMRFSQDKNALTDTRLYSSLGRFGVDAVIAMSWTMYHNAALSLHRWEKDGEWLRRICCYCAGGVGLPTLGDIAHNRVVVSQRDHLFH
jgi:hypothetical protein